MPGCILNLYRRFEEIVKWVARILLVYYVNPRYVIFFYLTTDNFTYKIKLLPTYYIYYHRITKFN